MKKHQYTQRNAFLGINYTDDIYVIWRRYNFEVYLFTLKIKIVNHLFGLLELELSIFS